MALESVLTLAVGCNVLIPFVPDLLFVLLNQFSNLFELLAEKPMRIVSRIFRTLVWVVEGVNCFFCSFLPPRGKEKVC
jgi:hypothetical protein